jgi:aerobic-type carbon monoxide dehydrogenase small subunit (CoxS/CutS family)
MPTTVPIALAVNGIRHELNVEPRWLLVDVIRDTLGLTGTHIGCEHGVCGTCTVLLAISTPCAWAGASAPSTSSAR